MYGLSEVVEGPAAEGPRQQQQHRSLPHKPFTPSEIRLAFPTIGTAPHPQTPPDTANPHDRTKWEESETSVRKRRHPAGGGGVRLDGDTEWGKDLVGEGVGNPGGGVSGRRLRGSNRSPSSANLAGGWSNPWGKVPAVAWFVTSTHRLGETRNCTPRANRKNHGPMAEKPKDSKRFTLRGQKYCNFCRSHSPDDG
jgi:hypothetical protein